MSKHSGKIGLYLLLIVALIAGYLYLNDQVSTQGSYTMGQLEKALEEDKVTDAVIHQNREVPTGYVTANIVSDGQKTVYVTDVKEAEALLEKHDIDPTIRNVPKDSSMIGTVLPVVLTGAILLFFFMMMNRQMSGGGGSNAKMMNFGKSRARMSSPDDKKVTFKDVAGLQEEKEDLEEVVDFLKSPQKYTKVGARIPKGVILVGPPGTGKTLLAKAVAGEAGVPFFSISGSDFVEMFVGVGASRVRDLFEEGKRHAPCIIFIDEIDAVARQRGTGMGGGHDEREQTLNQLLVEMDGFGVNEGIIVMAATNRVDILDPAILRPGRFDRKVGVGRPDVKGREEILMVHAKDKPLGDDVDLRQIAQTTAGFTGADLENLLNEAAIDAAKEGRPYIMQKDIKKAFIKVGIGAEKKSKVISDKEKKITAYHEAGHAILFHVLPHMDPVYTISIIPTGMGAAGYTMPLPDNDEMFNTKNKMLEDITTLLGGRVAEEIIFGDITTGASNDIKRATETARSMVMKYGMSEKIGLIAYGNDDDEVFIGRDLAHTRGYSEEVAREIDGEISRIIRECHKNAESKVISDKEKKITAYHEAGHAILFHVLPHMDPVYTISIIPTGMGAAGYTMPLPDNDEMFNTKNKMLEDITTLLGGRVAEEIIFGDITTGASNDIKRATETARSMVMKYGMSEKIGLIAYGNDDDEVFIGRDLAHTRGYSEEVAREIDGEISRIIRECHKNAESIIRENIGVLHSCAALLLEKEKVHREEFEALFTTENEEVAKTNE